MPDPFNLNPAQRAAVEHKDGPLLILAGAGSGKCVLPDTLISVNRELVPAHRIWRQFHGSELFDGEGYVSIPNRPLWVESFDESSGRFAMKPVQAIYRQRVSEVVRTLRLSDGSAISLTKAHKLYDGLRWTNDLTPGQVVAVPRRLPAGHKFLDRELCSFLGWWIGEGYDRWHHKNKSVLEFQLVLGDPTTLDHVRSLVELLENRYSSRVSKKRVVFRADKGTYSFSFGNQELARYLFRCGFVPNCRAAQKEVPSAVMSADNESVRAFLRSYADAEGHVNERRRTLELVSASELLIKQVSHLLRRFGIWSTKKTVTKYASNTTLQRRRQYHRLYISGPSLRTFADQIGFGLPSKAEALRRAAEVGCNPNVDLLPSSKLLCSLHERTRIGRKRLAAGVDSRYCIDKNASRSLYLSKIRPALLDLEHSAGKRFYGNQSTQTFTMEPQQAEAIQQARLQLDLLVEKDLCYPTVVDIEEHDYEGWVYDLTVAETHNFVAEGILCHNTRVLTHRIAHLIKDAHARPWEILAVTFTNKAARELRERLELLLEANDLGTRRGGPLSGMWVGTFHSVCARILREDVEALGGPYRRNFVIFDESEQATLIKDGLEALGLDDKAYPPRSVLSSISRAKSHAQSVEMFQEAAVGHSARMIGELYAFYQRELARQNALDFDDLLLLTVQLFKARPEVLDKYRQRFKFLLIDEYQDTNQTQYQLVSLLSAGTRNLCVVGDVDQSIYSFRAADFRIILQFQQDFPDARVVTLEENYRSTGRILAAANAVIENNTERYPKELWTQNPEGEKLVIYAAEDDRTEARWVVDTLRNELRPEFDPGDVAILYRTNAQSRVMEDELMRWGVPYRLVGGTRFYDRKEIKDTVAYLRLIFNPSDDAAFMRIANVPRRGLGATSLAKMAAAARDANLPMVRAAVEIEVPGLGPKPKKGLAEFSTWALGMHARIEELAIVELLERVLDESGLLTDLRRDESVEGRARVENVEELVTVARQFAETSDDTSLAAFLMQMALVSDLDQAQDGPGVTLMTLHSAKGLEFPAVFMVGLEEGIFPHKRTFDNPPEIEEERRLCYVGMTRAQKRLFISHARKRMVFGETTYAKPSRFLAEVPEDLVRLITAVPAEPEPVRSSTRWADDDASEVSWSQDWGMDEARGPGSRRAPKPSRQEVAVPFAIGDHVVHPAFGHGIVARIIGSGERACLAVSFPGLGQKVLDLRFAPLEKVD